jgi:hypothetical protein
MHDNVQRFMLAGAAHRPLREGSAAGIRAGEHKTCFCRPEKIGRFAKMAGEVDNLRDIHTLRVRSQVANLHVFDHTTAKRAHGQLLCEMNCAM